jgi:hypothetical protein
MASSMSSGPAEETEVAGDSVVGSMSWNCFPEREGTNYLVRLLALGKGGDRGGRGERGRGTSLLMKWRVSMYSGFLIVILCTVEVVVVDSCNFSPGCRKV